MVAGLQVQTINSQEGLEEIERRVLAKLKGSKSNNVHSISENVHEIREISDDKISKLERITLKRSFLSTRSELLVGFAVLMLNLFFNSNGWQGFLITLKFPVSVSEITIVFPWAILLLGAIVVRVYFMVGDAVYTLGRRHLRASSGNYAMERQEVEIPYESILFVEVNQNIFDRLLRVGTIQAGRNTQSKSEIVIKGVRYPHRWVKVIKQRMNMAKGINDKDEFLD